MKDHVVLLNELPLSHHETSVTNEIDADTVNAEYHKKHSHNNVQNDHKEIQRHARKNVMTSEYVRTICRSAERHRRSQELVSYD